MAVKALDIGEENNMNIGELAELIQIVLNKEGRGLEVVTTGHYGEPYKYSKDDFCVDTIAVDPGISPIKPRKVFRIEHKDIGPEPD